MECEKQESEADTKTFEFTFQSFQSINQSTICSDYGCHFTQLTTQQKDSQEMKRKIMYSNKKLHNEIEYNKHIPEANVRMMKLRTEVF